MKQTVLGRVEINLKRQLGQGILPYLLCDSEITNAYLDVELLTASQQRIDSLQSS
jgi:hypothetical protein